MYVCPICKNEFKTEEGVSKCLMKCWKETHTPQKAKNAPRGKDVEVRYVNDEITNFFNSFK